MDGFEFVNFPCPQCQSRQRAGKHLVGRTLTCMQCRGTFKIPAESSMDPVPVAERGSNADFELPVETSSAPLPEVPLTLPPVSEAAAESVLSDEFADSAPAEALVSETPPLDAAAPLDAPPLDAAPLGDLPPLEEPVLSLEGDAAGAAPVGEAALAPEGQIAVPLEGEALVAEAGVGGEPALGFDADLQLAPEAPLDAAPMAAAEPVLGLEDELDPSPLDVSLVPDGGDGDILAIVPEEPAPPPHPTKPSKAHA